MQDLQTGSLVSGFCFLSCLFQILNTPYRHGVAMVERDDPKSKASSRYRRSEENRIRREEGGRCFITILKKKKHLDIVTLESVSAAFQRELLHRFEVLTSLANWANARDVGTFAKSVFGQLLRTADPASPDPIRLEEITVLTAFDVMITERSKRAKDLVAKIPVQLHSPTQTAAPQTQNPPPPNGGTQTCQPLPQTKDPPPEEQGPETRPQTPATQMSATKPGRASSLTSRLRPPAELEAEHARKQEDERVRHESERRKRE
ncbi:MAG: hypothetical protein LQ352_000117 [Teloschistes flavicans]|nr:MAG: hypothetical protein LQ352_000117 [Teloschistes flavicans]